MKRNLMLVMAVIGVMAFILGCAPAPVAQPTAAPPTAASQPTAAAGEPTAAAAEPTAAGAAAAFDWKKYAGTEIRPFFWENKQANYWIEKLPEFEALTGIKVNYEKHTVAETYQKTLLELTTNPDKVDAFIFFPHQQKYKYVKEGFQEDLFPLINNPELTNPDYDFDDFFDAQIDGLTVDGKLIGIPFQAYTELMVYRKDLYEAKGLKPPETFDELQANAAALHDPANELYGLVTRGRGPDALHMWAEWNWNYGGDWLDENGKPMINSPESVAAFKMYGDILGKSGPPGAVNLVDAEMFALFCQGKAAHFMNWAGYSFDFNDPAKCPATAGKVGYLLYPKGPAGQVTHSMPLALSMSSKSQNKEATWLLLQWLTSKENIIPMQQQGLLQPRESAWADPGFTEGIAKTLPDWVEKATEALNKGRPDGLPPAEDVQAARDILGPVITTAIEGGDVQAAADKANAEYSKLLGFDQ